MRTHVAKGCIGRYRSVAKKEAALRARQNVMGLIWSSMMQVVKAEGFHSAPVSNIAYWYISEWMVLTQKVQ